MDPSASSQQFILASSATIILPTLERADSSPDPSNLEKCVFHGRKRHVLEKGRIREMEQLFEEKNIRDMEAHFEKDEHERNGHDILANIDFSDLANWKATCRLEDESHVVVIHAIHLAAARGNVLVMKLLRERLGHEVLNYRAVTYRGTETPEDDYTPIWAALLASQTEAVKWLLDQKVDVMIRDVDGLNAFHMFAWSFRCEDERARVRNFEHIAGKLFEISQKQIRRFEKEHGNQAAREKFGHSDTALSIRSGAFKHRKDLKDLEAEGLREKTPLEIASWSRSQFPKDMLHLLTNSHQCKSKSKLIEDVHRIAKRNTTAALSLVEKIPVQDDPELQLQLQKELCSEGQTALSESTRKGADRLAVESTKGFRENQLLFIDKKRDEEQIAVREIVSDSIIILKKPTQKDHEVGADVGKATASTTLKSVAKAGATSLDIVSIDGFEVGQKLTIEGLEQNEIVGLGSILLQSPLRFDHAIGARVQVMDDLRYRGSQQKLLEILLWAPLAAAKLLILLVSDPHVDNPQRYPPPSYASLPNGRMICTYQASEHKDGIPIWKQGQDGKSPQWHTVFGCNLAPGPFSTTYAVKIRALLLPGILSYKVLFVLTILTNLNLFSQIPVSAIVTCYWNYFVKDICFLLAWDVLALSAVFSLAVLKSTAVITWHIAWSVVLTDVFLSTMEVIGILREYWHVTSSVGEDNDNDDYVADARLMKNRVFLRLLPKSRIVFIISNALLLGTCDANIHEPSAYEKVVLAFIVVVCCWRIMIRLSVVPVLGPLIIAVAHSFYPLAGMFAFTGAVFVSFFFSFMIFKDRGRNIGFVLFYLYQSLFLSDRDSAESISGVDVAHEQYLDFQKEMYTGGGQPWLLDASAFLAVVTMSLFSLVLLNLTIGMYANYYTQVEPLANLIFERNRARHCIHCMLRPSWGLAGWMRSKTKYPELITFVGSSVCMILYVVSISCQSIVLPSVVFLAAMVTQLEVAFLATAGDFCNQNHYLWICHRADYDEQYYNMCRRKLYELCSLQRALSESDVSNHGNLQNLSSQLESTSKDIKSRSRQLKDITSDVTDAVVALEQQLWRQREQTKKSDQTWAPTDCPT